MTIPKGPKYPIWGIYGFNARNRNDGFADILGIWVLGPLGYERINAMTLKIGECALGYIGVEMPMCFYKCCLYVFFVLACERRRTHAHRLKTRSGSASPCSWCENRASAAPRLVEQGAAARKTGARDTDPRAHVFDPIG